MIMGTKGSIGSGSCTPIAPLPQPHWNTATTTP